jgi:hypothetical protein
MKSMMVIAAALFLWVGLEQGCMAQDASYSQQQELENAQDVSVGGQALVVGYPRTFPAPGSNPLPPPLPAPSHFTPPVMDGNFGSLVNVVGYKSVFTQEDANSLLQGHGKVRVLTTCFVPASGRRPKPALRVLPDPADKAAFSRRYRQIGIGNYKALDADTVSEQILGIALLEGLKMGADAMIFFEGASLTQVSSGYSAGLSDSFSFVNDAIGNGLGNLGTGGLGFGKGESAYSSKPWLRILFFSEVSPSTRPSPEYRPGLPAQEQKSGSGFEENLQDLQEPTLEQKYWGTQQLP